MARILIIDDDIDIAQNLAATLEMNGHAPTVINRITAGIEDQIADDPPDLIVLDVMFPDNPVAGFDVARKIHGHRKLRTLPIILLTSVNKEFPTNFSAADIDGNWMDVQDFMEKPVNVPALLQRVTALLAKRSSAKT